MIQRKLSQKIHPKQSSKTTFSLLAALSVGITTAVLPVAAHAQDAPKPRTASAYQDNYGRNVIGEEKLEQLKPTVTGGEAVIGEDGKALYEYTVKSGFPDDPNNVTAQRWMRLTFTEDPKVPFNKDEKGLPSIDGLPDGAKIEKVDEHSWRVVLGAEYLDMNNSGARVNNPDHAMWNAENGWDKDVAWSPKSEFKLRIPAKIEDASDDSTFDKGKVEVVSGRLVDIDLQDNLKVKYVDNDKSGLCTWTAHYETQLKVADASYWLQNVRVFSNPASTEHFKDLPERFKWLKPSLVKGEVKINGKKLTDLTPVGPTPMAEGGYEIGRSDVTKDVPPFYSNEWIKPELPVEVNYTFKNPCGEKVDKEVVEKRPEYVPGYKPGLAREFTFAQESGAFVGIIRPPEDAGASARFTFTKKIKSKGSVSVGDFVWEDTNGDGIQDAGEPGIAGVELKLEAADGQPVIDVNGNVVAPVKTDGNGKYSFDNLPVLTGGDTYTVTPVVPEGYKFTKPNQGSGALARFKDSSDGFAETIPGTLSEAGNKDLTLDFGFVKTSDDTNGNWWWLSLIPLAVLPLIPIFGNHGGSSQPIPPATPKQPAPNKENSQPKQEQPQQPAAKKPQNKQLATTGASVLGLLAIAVALVAGGALLIRSRKNS